MAATWKSEVRDGVVSVGDRRSTASELLDLLKGPGWRSDALCREYPDLHWFGETHRSVKATKAICAACLVRCECLAYAQADPSLQGIWGGLTARERNDLRQTAPLDRLTASA